MIIHITKEGLEEAAFIGFLFWFYDRVERHLHKHNIGARAFAKKPGVILCLRYGFFATALFFALLVGVWSVINTSRGTRFWDGFLCCADLISLPLWAIGTYQNIQSLSRAFQLRRRMSSVEQLKRRLEAGEAKYRNLSEGNELLRDAVEIRLVANRKFMLERQKSLKALYALQTKLEETQNRLNELREEGASEQAEREQPSEDKIDIEKAGIKKEQEELAVALEANLAETKRLSETKEVQRQEKILTRADIAILREELDDEEEKVKQIKRL